MHELIVDEARDLIAKILVVDVKNRIDVSSPLVLVARDVNNAKIENLLFLAAK